MAEIGVPFRPTVPVCRLSVRVEPLAVDRRTCEIWMTCRVGVSADHGFEVSTCATSSIGCQVAYFVVEEMPDW